jgi:hypothetical protein
MKDADLKRAYHRLCKKKPGTLSCTEACFRAFRAGVAYGLESQDQQDQQERHEQQITDAFMGMLKDDD